MILRTAGRDGGVEVSVQDTGKGIAESDLQQVFAPFYSTKGEGLGVGLSHQPVDRRDVRQPDIGKRTTPDGGAIFRVRLPAGSTAAEPRPAPLIFLVDDDAGVRKALVRLLRAAGHAVEAFASAREFLARERDDGPGCLVLDLRMPEMTGLGLQDALERAGYAIRCILVDGHGDIPASVKAMKAGAIDFLTKPVQNRDLLQAVERALARDRAARAAARISGTRPGHAWHT